MIAIDTNILVYAHREDAEHHQAAKAAVREAVSTPAAVAVPWPCVHEFLAVVTNPKIWKVPTPTGRAWEAVSALLSTPGVHPIGEGADHLVRLQELLTPDAVRGPRVHDARIAAICLSNGVDTLWSADRDFSWFPQLRVLNPLRSQA